MNGLSIPDFSAVRKERLKIRKGESNDIAGYIYFLSSLPVELIRDHGDGINQSFHQSISKPS